MRTAAERALEYIGLFKEEQKSRRTLDWGWIALAEQALKEAPLVTEVERPEIAEARTLATQVLADLQGSDPADVLTPDEAVQLRLARALLAVLSPQRRLEQEKP